MTEQSPDAQRGFQIDLIPEWGEPLDDDWQQECRRLAARLKDDLDGLDIDVVPTVQQLTEEEGVQHRALDGVALFSTLTLLMTQATGLAKALGTLHASLKPWLERRAGCKAVVRTPDGTEYVLTDLSANDLKELIAGTGGAAVETEQAQ